MIKEGADVTATNRRGETLLNAATNLRFFDARDQYLPLMQLLIDHGCDLNMRDEDGISALHKAAARLNLQAVELLVKAGANVSIRDKQGPTPLHYLVGDLDSFEQFKTARTDEDELERYDALRMNNIKAIANLLIEKGCNPNQLDDGGQTALSYAVAIGCGD